MTNNTSDENSSTPYNKPTHLNEIFWIWLILFVISLSANGLIFIIFAKIQQARSPANRLILNLSVAEFMLTLSTISFVLELLGVINTGETSGSVACKLQIYTIDVFYGASILTVTAAAIERYYAVIKPLKFNNFKRKLNIFIAFTWIGAAFIYSPMLWCCVAKKDDNSHLSCNCHSQWEKWYYYAIYGMFVVLVFYLIPLIVLLSTHIIVIRRLWFSQLSHTSVQLRDKKIKKVTRTMFILIILFFICWTPYNVLFTLHNFKVDFRSVYGIVWYGSLLLPFLHCCFNPIITLVCNGPMKLGLQDIALYLCRRQSKIGKSNIHPSYRMSIASPPETISIDGGTFSIGSSSNLPLSDENII